MPTNREAQRVYNIFVRYLKFWLDHPLIDDYPTDEEKHQRKLWQRRIQRLHKRYGEKKYGVYS